MADRRLRLLRPGGAPAAGPGPGVDDLDAVEVTLEPPRSGGPTAPEPAPFTESDVVPAFRSDLKIGPGDSAGLFDVTDPHTERAFALYDFELSVAHMLDGRRRVSDVVGSAGRLGIPVDVQALYRFVRQLWHYGFLAPPGGELAPGVDDRGGGVGRERWDEATRTLFQTGLRLMRQGRPGDARSYFEAVLGTDPGNAEATERLAAIERGEPTAAPAGRHAAAPAAPRPPRGPPRPRTILAAAAGVALVAGAGASWLLARAGAGRPVAARGSGVAPPPAAPHDPGVPASAPAPAPTPAWRTAPVSGRWHPLRAELRSAASGLLAWSRESDAGVQAGERIGAIRVGGGPAAVDARADARIAQLERLAAQDPVYKEFLEKALRDRRRRLERAARRVPIVATASGRLSIAVATGARRARGDLLGSVVDGEVWHLAARVEGPEPAREAACEVRGDDAADVAPCTVVGARRQGEGFEVTVSLPAARAPWLGSARSPGLRLGAPQSGADGPSPGASR